MKIAFFEIKEWEKKYIQKNLKGHKLMFFEEELSLDNVSKIKNFDAVSVFIYSNIDAKIISKLPKLKLIATRSTGFDHVALKEAKKKKITVSNVPFYGENTVAEHTLALILALSRNIHKSYVRTLRGDYSIEGLTGFDLKDKTIGIIGGGHIGLHVARMARAFGMDVLVYDRHHNEFVRDVVDFDYAGFDAVLKKSDIVSLHIPYNKDTHHIIDRKNIDKMKRGAIIINTARGGIIDTDALLSALESGKIAGAGLDVIEGEELIKEEHELLHHKTNPEKWKEIVRAHRIFEMDNVVFTPHNAFNSQEALVRILNETVQNILGFMNGDTKNLV